MKVFCLCFSEGTRTCRKIKSKNLLLSEECWVGATGNKVWGRAAWSQLEELTPIQIELSFYIWPIGVWALVYLLRNLPWYCVHKELFSSDMLLFPVLGSLSRAALSLYKTWTCHIPSSCFPHPAWVPLSDQKKGPYCGVVLSDSEAHRHK